MYKFKINNKANLIVLIIGILVSLGIGPLSPWVLLVYGAGLCYVWLYRTKWIWIYFGIFTFSIITFIINFSYQNAVVGSFAVNDIYLYITVGISLAGAIAYWVLNYKMIKKEKNAPKTNALEK